jgi:hypothetical protein
LFGQIDCTGSAANTTCKYNAPQEWPPGETATININGGANGNASVAVTYVSNIVSTDSMDDNLQEWW